MLLRNAAARGALTACTLIAATTFAPVIAAATTFADTVTRAKTAYAQIAAGKLDRSTLTPALGADLTDATQAVLAHEASVLGTPDSFAAIGQTDVDGVTTTIFALHFRGGLLEFTFGIDDATNKIAKLYFVPGPSHDPAL